MKTDPLKMYRIYELTLWVGKNLAFKGFNIRC